MRRSLLATLAISAAALAGGAGATTYTLTDIPLAPYTATAVVGINDSGQALVSFGNPSTKGAFVYQGGTATFLAAPLIAGGGNTATLSGNAINSSGTVVGEDIQTTNGVGLVYDDVGYVEKAGQYTFLTAPKAVSTQLTGINNSGVVLGRELTATSGGAFTYFTESGGVFTSIGAAGYSNVTAVGIDSAGDVFGNATVGGQRVGFVDSGGVYTLITIAGALTTNIQAVSESGVIAGNDFSNGKLQGFVDDGGVFTTVAAPFGAITEITGVNDAGTVVGTSSGLAFVDQDGVYSSLPLPSYDPDSNQGPDAINDNGLIGGSLYSGNGFNYEYTAFLATPVAAIGAGGVPEPAAWSLMLVGFGMAGAALRRRSLRLRTY